MASKILGVGNRTKILLLYNGIVKMDIISNCINKNFKYYDGSDFKYGKVKFNTSDKVDKFILNIYDKNNNIYTDTVIYGDKNMSISLLVNGGKINYKNKKLNGITKEKKDITHHLYYYIEELGSIYGDDININIDNMYRCDEIKTEAQVYDKINYDKSNYNIM